MKNSDLKIAYLLVSSPMPNIYVGGLMVTDGRGLPLEFRYTEPIQPTRIQQVLYGQVLSSYIKREVILETLLKNIETKFSCMLVEDENLVDYPSKGYPVLRVVATKSAPVGPVGKVQEISPGEILLQVTAEGCPVRLYAGKGKSDIPETAAPSSEVITILLDAGQEMDIVEPMRRIEKALEIICQEEGVTEGNASKC